MRGNENAPILVHKKVTSTYKSRTVGDETGPVIQVEMTNAEGKHKQIFSGKKHGNKG